MTLAGARAIMPGFFGRGTIAAGSNVGTAAAVPRFAESR